MLRKIPAIFIGKTIFFISRLLKIGGGSAAPGLYGLKIDPELVSKLSAQISQNIVITGTNGKTTTARLLSHLLKENNLKVVRNLTGSNLERGIASALISKSDWLGKIKGNLGIWEVDEAAFNNLVFKIKPEIIVFLNAFRDQLDRYGEVDTVTKKWREALEKIDWNPTILANSSDKNTSWITKLKDKKVFGFSVENHLVNDETKLKPAKFKSEFNARILKNNGLKGLELELSFEGNKKKVSFKLPGIYQVYDLLASSAVYYLINQPIDKINQFLESYKVAFGRLEEIRVGQTQAFVCLIKNPAGANSVLETILPEIKDGDKLLVALNDNLADGTDVSWIWDVDFERLQITNDKLQIICSGKRAKDMAVRLKYAGIKEDSLTLEDNLEKALEKSINDSSSRLFILPTYSALLSLQKILSKLGVKSQYWKEME